MYYYQKNIGDYRAATAHLTLLEHGVYNWLLDTYYSNEQPLPLDERVLFRLTLARSEDEKQAVRDVLGEFFTKTDAGWIQTRCDEEISKYHSKGDANRTNGKKGGRPPKTEPTDNPKITHRKPKNNPSETQTEPTDNLNQEPLTINQEPLTNNQSKPTHTTTEEFLKEDVGVFQKKLDECFLIFNFSPNERAKFLPKIRDCINAGAVRDDFEAGIMVAHENGKGSDYALGVVIRSLTNEKPKARASPKKSKHDLSEIDYGAGLSTDGRM